jgi:hypothetical protein
VDRAEDLRLLRSGGGHLGELRCDLANIKASPKGIEIDRGGGITAHRESLVEVPGPSTPSAALQSGERQ